MSKVGESCVGKDFINGLTDGNAEGTGTRPSFIPMLTVLFFFSVKTIEMK